MEAVLAYLDKVDPEAARRARARYACFDTYGEDAQAYGFASGLGPARPASARGPHPARRPAPVGRRVALRDGRIAEDDYFYAEQNAQRAGRRAVLPGDVPRRGLLLEPAGPPHGRDADSLGRALGPGRPTEGRGVGPQLASRRCAGDADGSRGEWNLGQLVRERHGRDAVSVGFTTYNGTVTAASNWDAPAERKRVRPALPGSYEALFHDVGAGRFLLCLRGDDRRGGPARAAIGAGHRGRSTGRRRSGPATTSWGAGGPVRRRDPPRRNPGRWSRSGPAANAAGPGCIRGRGRAARALDHGTSKPTLRWGFTTIPPPSPVNSSHHATASASPSGPARAITPVTGGDQEARVGPADPATVRGARGGPCLCGPPLRSPGCETARAGGPRPTGRARNADGGPR